MQSSIIFAAWVWGPILAIGGFVVALDPVKAWAGERLKPVLEWITRQL